MKTHFHFGTAESFRGIISHSQSQLLACLKGLSQIHKAFFTLVAPRQACVELIDFILSKHLGGDDFLHSVKSVLQSAFLSEKADLNFRYFFRMFLNLYVFSQEHPKMLS